MLLSSAPRQPLHQGYPAPELPTWQRRIPADGLSRRNVPHHAAMRRDARAIADGKVAGETALTADHHEIPKFGAPGDANLRDKHAATADDDVVPDLHEIINHCAVADDRIGAGAAV